MLSSFRSLLLASICVSLLRIASKVGSRLSTVFDEGIDTTRDGLEGFDGGIDGDPGERRQQQIQAGSRSHTWFRFSLLVLLLLLLDQCIGTESRSRISKLSCCAAQRVHDRGWRQVLTSWCGFWPYNHGYRTLHISHPGGIPSI